MKIKYYTLGCKVNQYETQALKESFEEKGHATCLENADLCVINTCTVTARSDHKSKDFIVRAKRENPAAKIAVCGCMVKDCHTLLEDLKVDFIVPQEKKADLVDIVLGAASTGKALLSLQVSHFHNHRAFIKIQDGCDNKCFFCKVPIARGASVSRNKEEVLREVKRLTPQHRELVLCGINLGLYGKDLKDQASLSGLLSEILSLDSLGRLRLSSLEPYSIQQSVIDSFNHPKMCPHVHLPFQSGDDRILGAMNRKETARLYEDLILRLRQIDPFFAISCDIIIGLPGEDEESFVKTCRFLERIRPMRMHIFTFSPRENTPLAHAPRCSRGEAKDRLSRLKGLAKQFSLEYKRSLVGRTCTIVCEEHSADYTCGYTENYIKVFCKGKIPLGGFATVQIQKVEADTVFAELIS